MSNHLDDCEDNQRPDRMRWPRKQPCGRPLDERRVVLIVLGSLVFAWRAVDGTYSIHVQEVSPYFQRQRSMGHAPTGPRLTVSPGIITIYL